MIYLLWAAIVLQGCITAWLARQVYHNAKMNDRNCLQRTQNWKRIVSRLSSQDDLNATVAKKLRNLGQPID